MFQIKKKVCFFTNAYSIEKLETIFCMLFCWNKNLSILVYLEFGPQFPGLSVSVRLLHQAELVLQPLLGVKGHPIILPIIYLKTKGEIKTSHCKVCFNINHSICFYDQAPYRAEMLT